MGTDGQRFSLGNNSAAISKPTNKTLGVTITRLSNEVVAEKEGQSKAVLFS